MKKLCIAMALATLVIAPVLAAGPSEDQAVPSKPATAAEKSQAKAARKAEGTAAAKSATAGDAAPGVTGPAKSPTKEERKTASAKRKAEGKQATKEPKDVSGPN